MEKPVSRLFLCLAISVCACLTVAIGQEPQSQQLGYVPDEVLVQFRPDAAASRRDAIVRAAGGQVMRRFDNLHVHRIRIAPGSTVASTAAALRLQGEVISAEPNFIRQVVLSPNDPSWADGTLWGLKKIQADAAWNLSTGSATVVVADIDTGVNYNHPDLAANMWRNPGEVPGNGVDDDGNGYVDDVYGIDTANNDRDPMDDHGHGTHTAGTIGAIGNNSTGVAGVNWNVKILPCKFLKADGSGSDAGAIECFNYIVALKKKGVNIRVTSNSWGGQRDPNSFPQTLKNAIDAAANVGILNVFAAGNNGSNNDVTPFDPASFDSAGIISVAASDASDQRAGFSNFGPTSVDIAAPGVSIYSTTGNGYGYSSGTSMAAPHVAGAAALLSAFNPALTATGIKTLLMDNSDKLSQWSGVVASGGRLNVFLPMVASNGDIPPVVSIVTPTQGSTYTAPASIAITASASDSDGTVTKVDFYANGSFIGTDSTSPYGVAWSNVPVGTYQLTAVATDDRLFTTTSAAVGVTVSASTIPTGRTNVALAANGGVATASSTYSSGHTASAVINGDRKGSPWGAGGGWNDATPTFPDWLRVDFASAQTIDEIDVFSVQDDVMAPIEPTASMTFSRYGITDFQLQYWTGTAWAAISGGVVTGNRLVWKPVIFTPVTTTAIRVNITGSIDGWSRLAEVEAYSGTTSPPPPPPPPTTRTNVALAANGGVATASSTYSSGHAPSAVINGDRKGSPWGAGGGWNDGTPTFPDWLRVDFSSAQAIDEIDVFSVQDDVMAPIEPTATMTFSRYGITDFQLQYWTGTAWAAIPGGAVTGNRLVWKQVTFTPVTTTAIRVNITGSIDGWSRLAEVEAYSGSTSPPPPPPPPPTTRTNVALATNGGVATASSTYSSGHAPGAVINGDRKGSPWGAGGGWNDATPTFPDWLRVDFSSAQAIDEIDVFSVQDNVMTPSEPTATMTFSRYGITDFQLQYWTGTAWAAIPGGAVTGNRLVWKQVTFTPVTTTAIRVNITGSIDGWSRLAEVEAYSGSTSPPPPTTRINVALATNGGVSASSSNFPGAYTSKGTINGDRKGTPWGNGGGWSDASMQFPDWLRIDFAGAKTIDEIDVFSLQDNTVAPIEPTATTTFSSYGITDFQLHFWTGIAWVPIPGGTVTGNRLVWRKITFAPVTTTAIRVFITGSMDGWSRLAEVEAYGVDASTPPIPPPTTLIGFPSDNWWSRDISNAPVDPNSANYIAFINNGSLRRLHPDFGGLYGMPYVVVDSTVPKRAVQFDYSGESDGVDHNTDRSFPFYPIPDSAITQRSMIEGMEPGNVDLRRENDRHLLIVDKDKRQLYELWNVFFDGTQWLAGSGALFDMNTNGRRPEGWTSSDAAGLAILPGLLRYDEMYGTAEIRHALRVTIRASNNYVYPASHSGGWTSGALPMGARLRLKASKDLSGFSPEMQRVLRAMQRYGLIVADNGGDMFISGEYDPRWNNDVLNPAFGLVSASDFEVVQLAFD